MTVSRTWAESNQRYLVASIDEIRLLLERRIGQAAAEAIEEEKEQDTRQVSVPPSPPPPPLPAADAAGSAEAPAAAAFLPNWTEESPPALETICSLFGLSAFEKSILLLCAGVELDSRIAQLCAKAQGNINSTYPTFGLALAVLPEAHWSALTPASPLRAFKLIDLYTHTHTAVVSSPLYIEERVLHYLAGVSYLEKQMQSILKPVRVTATMGDSHKALAKSVLLALKDKKNKNDNRQEKLLPCIQLWGTDESSKLAIAKLVCNEIGLDLWSLPGELVPVKPDEMENFVRLWDRESALLGSGLYVSAEDIADPSMQKPIRRLIEDISGSLSFLGTAESWSKLNRFTTTLEVRKPLKAEQRQIWKSCLGEDEKFDGIDLEISKIVSQFDLNASAIQTAAAITAISPEKPVPTSGRSNYLFTALWESTRALSRPKMGGLAQLIITKAKMDDLILPAREKQLLHLIAVHLKQKYKVYEEWGFEVTSARGLGITALFAGESGTGKTMAAEVLANELNLDLFRIDLAMVVSKYIGETEKNLRQVFDTAEDAALSCFLTKLMCYSANGAKYETATIAMPILRLDICYSEWKPIEVLPFWRQTRRTLSILLLCDASGLL